MPPAPRRAPVDVVLIGCAIEENLSLAYLAAACDRAGLRAELLGYTELERLDEVLGRALTFQPRAIGLSLTYQAHAPALMDLAARLRHAGFRGLLCAGGHFATLACDQILRDTSSLDCIVRHEGEETLVELLALLRDHPRPEPSALQRIAGLAFRTPDGTISHAPPRRLPPLDSLPWPRRKPAAALRMGIAVAPIVGSRGCYGACSFCSIHAWQRSADGPSFRLRSIDDLVGEMAWLRRERDVQVFDVLDDNFFVPSRERNLARVSDLETALRDHGIDDIALVLKGRSTDVDAAVLDVLIRVGIIRMYAGIEAASEQGLRSLGRGMRVQDNERALQLLDEREVFHAFNLLLFDPDTTLQTVLPSLALLEANAAVPFDFCRAQVYAATPLEDRLLRENRLRGSYLAWAYDLADPRADLMFRIVNVAFHQRNFHPDGMATANLNLRFDMEILRHFHADACDPALYQAAVDFSRRVGMSSVQQLRAIHAFASDVDLADARSIQAFTLGTARTIHRDDFALLTRLSHIRGAMNAALRTSRGGTRGEGR